MPGSDLEPQLQQAPSRYHADPPFRLTSTMDMVRITDAMHGWMHVLVYCTVQNTNDMAKEYSIVQSTNTWTATGQGAQCESPACQLNCIYTQHFFQPCLRPIHMPLGGPGWFLRVIDIDTGALVSSP